MGIKNRIARYSLIAFAFSLPFSSALYRISVLILSLVLFADIYGVVRDSVKSNSVAFNFSSYKQKIIYLPIMLAFWVYISRLWSNAPQDLFSFEASRYVKLLMIPALAYLQVTYLPNRYKLLIVAFLSGVCMLMLPTFLDVSGLFHLLGLNGQSFANESYRLDSDLGSDLVYFRNHIVHGFMVSILCASLLIFYANAKSKRPLYLVGVALCIGDILFCIIGRIALIGLIGSLILLLYSSHVERRIKFIASLSLVASFVFLVGVNHSTQMRLESIYNEAYGFFVEQNSNTSGGIRLHYWSISWQLFVDHPLWGSGAGSFRNFLISNNDPFVSQNHFHTHSEYLTLLSQYGAIGLGIFFIFMRQVYKLLAKFESTDIKYCIFATLTIFMINAITDSSLNNLWEGWSFVLFTSFVVANAILKEHIYAPAK